MRNKILFYLFGISKCATFDGTSAISCSGDICTLTMSDGTTFTGKERDQVVNFRNIPYAEPPVGDLRWKQPIGRFDYGGAAIDGIEFGPICISEGQNNGAADTLGLSEDCLTLNIQVAKSVIDSGEQVPIVVYIHGGSFNGGSGQRVDERLVTMQNVIVVSMNYRLGVFGFLYSPNTEPGQTFNGNWGLVDQNVALEWVNKFGGHFRGKVDSVALTCCSAGCKSAWHHLVQPSSWPFFHRVVSTGIGLGDGFDEDVGIQMFNAMLDETDCDSKDCLRNVDFTVLMDAANKAKTAVVRTDTVVGAMFKPIIDGVMFDRTVRESVRLGLMKPNTPIAWSHAEHDAFVFAEPNFKLIRHWIEANHAPWQEANMNSQIQSVIQSSGFQIPSDYPDQMLELLYGVENVDPSLFGCGNNPDETGIVTDCKSQFSHFATASNFVCNTRNSFDVVTQDPTFGPIFPMQFEMRSCDTFDNPTKTCHCAEQPWLLSSANPASYLETPEEQEIAQMIQDAYGQFFRTGTFPEGTLQDYVTLGKGNTNVIGHTGLSQAPRFKEECQFLDNMDNYDMKKWAFRGDYDEVTTTTTTTTSTTTTVCPEMKWKGKKATKIIYRGRDDNGKRSYTVRQSIANNSNFHPNLRESPYTGFAMFSRKYCGVEFFNALSDGSIQLAISDYEDTYEIRHMHTRMGGSKNTQVTIQFYQKYVGTKDAPWTKNGGNVLKRDQFFLSLTGIPEEFDISKEAECFNLLTGVLPNGFSNDEDWSECAAGQKGAGW